MVKGALQGDRENLGGGLQGLRAPPLGIGLYDEAGRYKALDISYHRDELYLLVRDEIMNLFSYHLRLTHLCSLQALRFVSMSVLCCGLQKGQL